MKNDQWRHPVNLLMICVLISFVVVLKLTFWDGLGKKPQNINPRSPETVVPVAPHLGGEEQPPLQGGPLDLTKEGCDRCGDPLEGTVFIVHDGGEIWLYCADCATNGTRPMRLLGRKKHALCENIAGVKFLKCWTASKYGQFMDGTSTHYWAICYDGKRSWSLNYKTGEIEGSYS